ncbi:c-type cytochrome [bacterium]|nr:c-type cytochrome [Alphaproteobacteria bacterium]MDC0607122.1 c-type cytochrome [bacterium]
MRKANLRLRIVGLARLWALVIAAMFGAMSVVIFGAISGAVAQTDLADQIAKADLGYGEYLAGECAACHQKSGKGIPQINGIEAETFVTIVKAYRSKERDNKVMQMMAGRLDDEQIISLAAYFSSLPK